MPGIDGFEFLKRVRHTAELASVPVVALSGFGYEGANAALPDGFSAHVTKPVEPDTLSRVIQKLVGGQ